MMIIMNGEPKLNKVWAWVKRKSTGSSVKNAIIVGVDYPAYQLHKELQKEGLYRAVFLLTRNPGTIIPPLVMHN